jgi:hypothetical protein
MNLARDACGTQRLRARGALLALAAHGSAIQLSSTARLREGGDIHIEAREGDLTLEATRIRTEGELTLATPGQLNLAAMKTLDYARSHAESKDDAWQKVKGEGHHDERLEHTQLEYGQLRLAAQAARVDGQQSELEALSTQPGMGWFKELQQVQNVDWRKIDTTHERWAYEQEGMTEAAAVVVSVVVAVFTAGTASALVGEMAGAAAGSGSAMAAAGAATATSAAVSAGAGNIALTSALTSMASNASVQLINNKGDVGAALEATFSEEAMKGYAVAGITAGLTNGFIDQAFGADTDALSGTTAGLDLSSLEDVGQFALHSGARGLTQAAVDAAINGGSFEEKLAGALTGQAIHVVSAVSLNQVGDWAQRHDIESGAWQKIAVKALVGGLISQAATGEFAPGALAAGANEALVEQLARLSQDDPKLLGTASQLVGAVAGAITGGDAQFSSNLAAYDMQYNFLMHDESAKRLRLRDEREACADAACRADKQGEIDHLDRLDSWRDEQIKQACMSPASNACQSWAAAIHIAGQSYEGQHGNAVDTAERASVQQHAFMYQQAANNPFLHGVGTGLLKLTPPGLAVGLVGGISATVEGLIENGAEQTLINTVNAIEDFPDQLKLRLASDDPSVRGEAFVDVVSLGLGGTALTAQGVKLTINATQKAAIARELARAQEGAIAKARVENGFYRDGGIADPSRTLSATGNWKPAWEVTAREAGTLVAERLPAGAVVTQRVPANALNASAVAGKPGYLPPYVPNTETVTFTTMQADRYVRVYVDGSRSGQASEWLMRAADVEGLTGAQIASKYALPQIPTMITDAHIPAGQSLRASIANDIQIRQGIGGNGGGGGVQFEVLSKPADDLVFQSWFSNPRGLR